MLLIMLLKWIKIVYSCVLVRLMWSVAIQGQVLISQAHLEQVVFENLVVGSGHSATEGLLVGEGLVGTLSQSSLTYRTQSKTPCGLYAARHMLYVYDCSFGWGVIVGLFSRAVSFASIGYSASYT